MNAIILKRILLFLLFPILVSIPFFAADPTLRVIGAALTVFYVAFLIFLRGGGKRGEEEDEEDDPEESEEDEERAEESRRHTPPAPGAVFSSAREEKIITDDTYTPGAESSEPGPRYEREVYENIANERLPKEVERGGQFAFALERLLIIVKESFQAHSALFFWYNARSERFSIEQCATNSREINREKFAVEDDALSRIVRNGEPLAIDKISATVEADQIRYYKKPQRIRSFVGAPLYYNDKLVAVLALDSREEDMYGVETIYSLGRFIRLITLLISLFEEKYSETLSQQRLNGLLLLAAATREFGDTAAFLSIVEKAAEQLLPWEAFAFVRYDAPSGRYVTAKTANKTSLTFVGENLSIDLEGTLVGKCVYTGVPVKIDDASKEKYVRYSNAESVSFEGSFLAVPLAFKEEIFGVFCFERVKRNAYANEEVKFVQNALTVLSYAVYSRVNEETLKNYIAVDVETGALKSSAFIEALTKNLARAASVEAPGALAMIRVDDFVEQDSLFGEESFSGVAPTVVETVRKELTPFEDFGRLDERMFAVYFFNKEPKDAFLIAERIRKKIARQPVAVANRQTAVTVSIGVASADGAPTADAAMENARLALEKARENGGNKVMDV
ncbi:MAG: GAF domain-containing protein [Ignavibacteriales bacterium]|nr:GAF domain-containing protein [Ignavibacteriales bacterium]